MTFYSISLSAAIKIPTQTYGRVTSVLADTLIVKLFYWKAVKLHCVHNVLMKKMLGCY